MTRDILNNNNHQGFVSQYRLKARQSRLGYIVKVCTRKTRLRDRPPLVRYLGSLTDRQPTGERNGNRKTGFHVSKLINERLKGKTMDSHLSRSMALWVVILKVKKLLSPIFCTFVT